MSREFVIAEADVEPTPIGRSELKQHTAGRTPETYYRVGYTVEGAEPRLIDRYIRNERDAIKQATAAAASIRRQLSKIGAPTAVSGWTQRWQVRTAEHYDAAQTTTSEGAQRGA